MMSPHRTTAAPDLLAATGAAVLSLFDRPAVAWVWGGVASVLTALGADVFTGIWLLAGAASALDWSSGVRAVKALRPEAYDPAKKAAGRDQKIITLILLLLLRGMEQWAVTAGLLNVSWFLDKIGLDTLAAAPPGVLSALFAAAVFVDEARSIYMHRLRLGGRPIMLFTLAFGLLDAVQRRFHGQAREALEAAPWPSSVVAERMMDEMAHAAQTGEPAPTRRASDAALMELREAEIIPPPPPSPLPPEAP